MNRRQWMRSAFAAAILAGLDRTGWLWAQQQSTPDLLRGGRREGTLTFADEANVPMEQPFGEELDGRSYTDLSRLAPESVKTPTAAFYVRTRASGLFESDKASTIRVDGLVSEPYDIRTEDLVRQAKPTGTHLMECAGNARVIHFGLMSVADWSGVPALDLVARRMKPQATRVLISGFDQYRLPSRSSMPGASWVFTFDDLKSSNAFFATAMNGQPLPRDHGAPVRLVLSGWYGCCCIKWVNGITLVDDSAPATSQMQEYAARILQTEMPLARDFRPATIDQAAMPVRIEKWRFGSAVRYYVVGILWGGSRAIQSLQVRFDPSEEFVPVNWLEQRANDPWSFWAHLWTPVRTGRHTVRLRVARPDVVARRLDAGYYERTIDIPEVGRTT